MPHGGMIMASMNLTGSLVLANFNENIEQFTQELKVNFLEPIYKGPFKVKKKGRNSVVTLIEFRDSEGKLTAMLFGTWYIYSNRK